jgi:hypothetical protein
MAKRGPLWRTHGTSEAKAVAALQGADVQSTVGLLKLLLEVSNFSPLVLFQSRV